MYEYAGHFPSNPACQYAESWMVRLSNLISWYRRYLLYLLAHRC